MSREELERWNQRYGEAEYIFGTAPNAFLAAHASLLKPGQRALCVADGEGRNSGGEGTPPGGEPRRAGVTTNSQQPTSGPGWEAAFDVIAAIFVQFADRRALPALAARAAVHMQAGRRA